MRGGVFTGWNGGRPEPVADARGGSRARARAGAADRERTSGVGGNARPAARRVASVPDEPGDRRGSRQPQGTGSRFTDFELGLGQSFEPGARRSARIAGANAAIAQSSANVDEITRVVLRSGRRRLLPRRARERADSSCSNATQELAASVYSVADRRFKAGDIAVLDVNIARASLARVQGRTRGGRSVEGVGARRAASSFCGSRKTSPSTGRLRARRDADLTAALQAASQRPELRALEAAVQEAEAELRLGGAFSKPDYGVGVRYSREEGDQIVLGGMTVTLPMFSKGQEQRAVGAARAARLRAELDAARTRVQLEVRSAFDAYNRRLAAVRVLETEAIPGLDENEQLTTRSFEVGQLGLPELLLIRREILDTRSQYLDALLEAALARIDLDASAAILR